MASALEQLAASPYCLFIEKVFVIGGGQMPREAIRAPGCDAIHVTEIETSFNVTSSSLLLIPWYSPSCMETMQAKSPFPIPIFSLNLSTHSINPLPVSAHAWLSKTPQIHPPTLMRTCKSDHLSHAHSLTPSLTFHHLFSL